MKMTGLKPLFWKECHENLRWAVLALLGLSLGLAYAEFRQPEFSGLPRVWGDANLVLTIAAPLIALALGLLQILPELRRDQWAFLVHRPVSRTTLFFGKVIPGLSLYLLATIPPLLGFAFWASFPSHVPAPFDFRFTLAGWAAILSGLPFYFAGLLVALRPARWYGSRALPILAAVTGPWAANGLGEFWQAALVCFLTAAVLIIAAWGSFVTGGAYKEQTKPTRFALGLTLYPAVVAVSFGIGMLCFGAYNLVTGNGTEWWRNEYHFDTKGRFFYTSEHGMDIAHQDRKTLTVTDLSGRTVDPDVWANLNQHNKILEVQYLPVNFNSGADRISYQQPDRYVSSISQYDDPTPHVLTNWYYDSRSRQIIQYTISKSGFPLRHFLGPKGYSEISNQAGQFPEGTVSNELFAGLPLLRFPHSLYWYSTLHPAVVLLQAASDPEGIVGTAKFEPDETYVDSAKRGHPAAYFVVANHQVTVYARANGETPPESTRRLFTTPLAFSSDDVEVAVMPDLSRFFFLYQDRKGTVTVNHVVTVASDGRIVKTVTGTPITDKVSRRQSQSLTYAPAVIVPAFTEPLLIAFESLGRVLNWASVAGTSDSRKDLAWAFLFSCLSGLVSASFAWQISRRWGDNRRGQITWALGVFWLGLYGVLLMLALRAWPARMACPNCGRLRVVDRETCEHCGARFALPVRDGTEIFEAESVRVEGPIPAR